MKNLKYALIFGSIFLFLAPTSYCQPNVREIIPSSWTVTKTIIVPSDQLSVFNQKLNGQIISLENFIISANQIPLQINVIKCKNNSDAQNIYNSLLSVHGSKNNCLKIDKTVYEIITNSWFLAKKVQSLFLKNKPVVWQLTMYVAPIKKSTDMEWNDLFNLLNTFQKDANSSTIKKQILQLSRDFVFGNQLILNARTVGGIETKYNFPDETVIIENKKQDKVIYHIKNPPVVLNIPRIKIQAYIPVQGFTEYKPGRNIDLDFYTAPNDYWPVNAVQIQSILHKIIKKDDTELDKLHSIQNWVYRNISYGGKIGSRYGVIQVLKQKFGRCWDKSDVFITLCRAAKLPARQIAGWVHNMGGHIWAEVYITDKGWIQVDATTPFLGVPDEYIPIFIIEDGEIHGVYWGVPIIKLFNS